MDNILIPCSDRLPSEGGEYKIKHNCGTNNGEGVMQYDTATGWKVPEPIQDFYKVLAWYEN